MKKIPITENKLLTVKSRKKLESKKAAKAAVVCVTSSDKEVTPKKRKKGPPIESASAVTPHTIQVPVLPPSVVKALITELKVQFPDVSEQLLLIREYMRFIYLKAIHGSVLGPSFIIEKLWHLHILNTQSYAVFCNTNNYEFVHCTTKKDPDALFQTLKHYVNTFVEVPPKRIWSKVYDSNSTSVDEDTPYIKKRKTEVRPIEYYDMHVGIYTQEDLDGPFGLLIDALGYDPLAAMQMSYGPKVYTLSDVVGPIGNELIQSIFKF